MQKFADDQGLLDSIAELRAALTAASGILAHKATSETDELAVLASLLYRVANEDGAARKQAIRALEEGAGYIPGMGSGEAYPCV